MNNGVELDNVKVAIEMGINQFDTSFGGIGGSPFMKGSRGNIATEEMVDHLNRLGYTPGIVTNKVATASRICLLYTYDAADDLLCVDLGGRRII